MTHIYCILCFLNTSLYACLYCDVWIAAIASSRTSLATLTVVMCSASQCKLRSLPVNSGMLNVICIVTYCNGVFAIKAYVGKQFEFTPQGSAVNIILSCNSVLDVLADNVRQKPGAMNIADDVVLCGGDEDGVTGYLWSRRKALEES